MDKLKKFDSPSISIYNKSHLKFCRAKEAFIIPFINYLHNVSTLQLVLVPCGGGRTSPCTSP